jgi:hypothetical protein
MRFVAQKCMQLGSVVDVLQIFLILGKLSMESNRFNSSVLSY